MQVTEQDIARIPRGNVRVPVAEFAQVWITAEQRCETPGLRDWYSAGIALDGCGDGASGGWPTLVSREGPGDPPEQTGI